MKLLLFAGILSAGFTSAAEIWPDVNACEKSERDGAVRKTMEFASGVRFDATFEITSKGNGTVALPGLLIGVFDSHDEGRLFRGWLLRCEWRQYDSVVEFVVSGTAETSGAVHASLPVRGRFRYDAATRRFRVVTCSPEIYFRHTSD